MATVVVGIDGSQGALDALRVALDEARLRDARLRVVAVWNVPPVAYGAGIAPDEEEVADFRRTAEDALELSLAAVAPDAVGVEIDRVVGQGRPANVLCEEARDAELLVVGSRGLGGMRSLVLGSVGRDCCHHAACPVLIVPVSAHEHVEHAHAHV